MNPPATRLRTVAVVLAGGSGSRVGLDIPKQLLKVAGRTIIEHTVGALHDCQEIDEIMIVMAADHLSQVEDLLGDERFPRVTALIRGGRDRNELTRKALDAMGEQECNVLFHDAVRPLVSRRVLEECIAALATYEAVDVAIPSADTIVRVRRIWRASGWCHSRMATCSGSAEILRASWSSMTRWRTSGPRSRRPAPSIPVR